MDTRDAIRRAIQAAGTQAKLAALMDPPMRQSSVAEWVRRGRVPAERVQHVADVTGVPEHELRPDIYRRPPA